MYPVFFFLYSTNNTTFNRIDFDWYILRSKTSYARYCCVEEVYWQQQQQQHAEIQKHWTDNLLFTTPQKLQNVTKRKTVNGNKLLHVASHEVTREHMRNGRLAPQSLLRSVSIYLYLVYLPSLSFSLHIISVEMAMWYSDVRQTGRDIA